MSEKDLPVPGENLDRLIYEIRGQKVMLDADLAEVYGVETRAIVQAVKRNSRRFPVDFIFQLSEAEWDSLRSQIVISKGKGGRRYRPYVFTEHGAIMAAMVLNSPQAVQMSVFVVRAFLKMRAALSETREQARKLSALEKELKERLGVHEAAIVTILQRVMDIIDPPALPAPSKKGIGFHVKEAKARYRARTSR
jgi:phage regulator Rha-like protein